MMLELKLNDYTSLEIEERVVNAGHPGYYDGPPERCYPSEGDETEITRAWLIRNGKERPLDTYKLEWMLVKRFGEDWRLEATPL